MVAGDADDRAVGGQLAELGVERLDRALLDCRVLRVARPCPSPSDARRRTCRPPPGARGPARCGRAGRPASRPSRGRRAARGRPLGEAEQELRIAEEAAMQPVALREARRRARAAPPLERDHVQRRQAVLRAALLTGCAARSSTSCRVQASAARAVGSASGTSGCGRSTGIPVAEERVRVRHALVGTRSARAGSPRRAAHASARSEAVDLEARAGARRARPRPPRPRRASRAAGEPEPVVAPLGRAQRREGEHVTGIDILPARRAPRRPRVRGTLRACSRASPSARSRSTAPSRARRRRSGRTSPSPRARRGSACPLPRSRSVRRAIVRAVGEPVEEDDEDRIHTRRLTG